GQPGGAVAPRLSLRPHMSCFFFSSRRRHTSFSRDWSSDVCSSDLGYAGELLEWLSSSLTRLQWVEEAVEEIGWGNKFDMLIALQAGQLHEKEHVFNIVLDELSRLVDEQE